MFEQKPTKEPSAGAVKGWRTLIIFDCDGVLVDTEEINRSALITVLSGIGIHVTEEEAAEHLHGLSNRGIKEKVKAPWGITLGDRFTPHFPYQPCMACRSQQHWRPL